MCLSSESYLGKIAVEPTIGISGNACWVLCCGRPRFRCGQNQDEKAVPVLALEMHAVISRFHRDDCVEHYVLFIIYILSGTALLAWSHRNSSKFYRFILYIGNRIKMYDYLKKWLTEPPSLTSTLKLTLLVQMQIIQKTYK